MTAEYSNTLDEVDQLNLVFGYGADVATRSTEEYQITLFQLFSFYVEIYSSGKRMLFEIKGFFFTEVVACTTSIPLLRRSIAFVKLAQQL
ncbi:MAG: hypothetical protein IPL54_16905 [Chitinophagaceae bacterium]|nr:hypothetical protein [Chitinophagaceae bacterium]